MSLLGAPLEEAEIEELRSQFPDFEGLTPEEAKYWSKPDLELFFSSNGTTRPSTSPGQMTCPLLSRLRQVLAQTKISEATTEYKSFCRHLLEQKDVRVLPSVAECKEVNQVAKSPATSKAPVVITPTSGWVGKDWGFNFWKEKYPREWWKCRSRNPAFSADNFGPDQVEVEGSIEEIIDYALLLQRLDPDCIEENAIAFPRVSADGWCPFAGGASQLFASSWKQLAPAGLTDLTARWVKRFAEVFNLEWLEFLARFYKVTVAPPGSVRRLHRANHGAHMWYRQLDGRRLFFLFPPREGRNLYEETGDPIEGVEGYAAAVSSADLFFPREKRHPLISQAKGQFAVLTPGCTLVVPSGWWQYSVSLDASLTLHHVYWTSENRSQICAELMEAFVGNKMPLELKQLAARNIAQVHEQIMDDEDSDAD